MDDKNQPKKHFKKPAHTVKLFFVRKNLKQKCDKNLKFV